MTPFEYVSVLISIILGLGITFLLTGVAEIIKRWNTLKHFWPYLIWIVLVFVLHLQEWWLCYELKSVDSWSLPSFLFVISYPILLFILANLLFPTEWTTGFDVKAFYFKTSSKFFICIIISAIISVIQNVLISGYQLEDQFVQAFVMLIFSSLLIWPTRNVAVHTIVAIVMLLTMIGGLFLIETPVISQ
jgi:hypothetical protein